MTIHFVHDNRIPKRTGENFNIAASMSINPALTGQASRGAPSAAAVEAAAWFGPTGSFNGQLPIVDLAAEDVTASPVGEDDDDEEETAQQIPPFGQNPANSSNPVPVKQEGLFTE